jgi:hypothetical protein
MFHSILIDPTERLACPKCNQGFPLYEALSRQALARYATELERTLGQMRAQLDAARREAAALRRQLLVPTS